MKQVQNGIMNDSILGDFYLLGAKGVYVDTWAVKKDEKKSSAVYISFKSQCKLFCVWLLETAKMLL